MGQEGRVENSLLSQGSGGNPICLMSLESQETGGDPFLHLFTLQPT